MPYPNLTGKHAYDAMFTPQDLFASQKGVRAYPDLSGLLGAVLCYQPRIIDRIVAAGTADRLHGIPGEAFLVEVGSIDGERGGRIAICGRFGVGAPVAAVVLEGLVALGVRRVVSVGTAGSLQRGVEIGDLVLCTGAVRDEGVSYHYIDPETPALPDAAMTERLRAALTAGLGGHPLRAGPSWTIDAPFRETVEEARHFQSLGVQTVEMEASALFAVAAHRGIPLASAFVISDSLADLVWTPRFHDPVVDRGLDALYAAAVVTLLGDLG